MAMAHFGFGHHSNQTPEVTWPVSSTGERGSAMHSSPQGAGGGASPEDMAASKPVKRHNTGSLRLLCVREN